MSKSWLSFAECDTLALGGGVSGVYALKLLGGKLGYCEIHCGNATWLVSISSLVHMRYHPDSTDMAILKSKLCNFKNLRHISIIIPL